MSVYYTKPGWISTAKCHQFPKIRIFLFFQTRDILPLIFAPTHYKMIGMRANTEDYYKLFNDWDEGRVAQFDAIMADPELEEIKPRLQQWYSEAKNFPGIGNKGAKALAFAMLKTVFLMGTSHPAETQEAMAIGKMVNAAAPLEWRV
jgi:hypothetical protein